MKQEVKNQTDYRFGGLSYSTDRKYLVDTNGEPISLRPKSLEVFRYLAAHKDSVVSRQAIVDSVWHDVHVTEDSLTQCIGEIRKCLGPNAKHILKTIPKRGYTLIPDRESTTKTQTQSDNPGAIKKNYRWIVALLALLVPAFFIYSNWLNNKPEVQVAGSQANSFATPLNLQVDFTSESQTINPDRLMDELSLALTRYKTIELVARDNAAYELDVDLRDDNVSEPYLMVGLSDSQEQKVVFTKQVFFNSDDASSLADRVSALVASPATGAIGRHLLYRGKRKSVDELSRAECYAHGYDCTNCSGELDTVDKRAQTCLANILATDDQDVRAWGLQSTIYAKQYQWSTNLGEPMRTNIELRKEIAQKAVAAANRAEQLSDGTDSSVYWGMASAYLAGCEIPKMRNAIDRGLAINPADPGMLGTFGNWLAYSGNWDEGAAMVDKAIALEPFERAYNERNWLSHLQLSYTLPYLDRIDDAKAAADKLQMTFPGITVEQALQLYKLYCFPDDYLLQMKKGLQMAGLPERGDSSDLNNIVLPAAKTTQIGDWSVEYMDLGTGQPIVFVHGSMSDYRTWAHYQNPVSEKYRFISYSRRYFGSQKWTDDGEKFSDSQNAKDLEDFIEHLNLGPVTLVTWSSSGSIATMLTLDRPDLVNGIVNYEPNTIDYDDTTDSDYPLAERDRFLGTFGRFLKMLENGNEEDATKAFMETAFEKQPGEFESELMAIRRVVIDSARVLPVQFSATRDNRNISCEDISKIEAPVLILTGSLTNDYWQYRAKRYAECAPNSKLEVIEGVNHAGPIRVPKKVFARIDAFAQSVISRAER